MLRVFVLGLDGLSYDLVDLWNFQHLKQSRWKHFRSIINEKHGEPLSPQVWGSFITGVRQDIDDWRLYTKPVEWIRWNTPLRRIRGSGWLISRTFGKRILIPILNVLQRQKKFVEKGHLKGSILFDLIPNSIAVNVPTYNLDPGWLFGYTKRILEGDIVAFEAQVMENTELMVQETLRRIPEDWRFFMAWFPTADLMGHAFVTRSKKMRQIYNRLNMLAYNISNKLPEDCLMIIISDHGMKVSVDGTSGCHSNYAFCSFSRDIEWSPEKITDFYDFIKSQVMGV